MSGGRYTKKLPEYIYFVGEGEWIQGPYVRPQRYQDNRKFKITEIKDDTKEKKGTVFIDYDSMIDAASIHEEIEKMLKRLGIEYTESGSEEDGSVEIKYKYFK